MIFDDIQLTEKWTLEAWISKANTTNTRPNKHITTQCPCIVFTYCHCKCKPRRKLQAFKVEWQVGRNRWDKWNKKHFLLCTFLRELLLRWRCCWVSSPGADLKYALIISKVKSLAMFGKNHLPTESSNCQTDLDCFVDFASFSLTLQRLFSCYRTSTINDLVSFL